MIRRFLPALTLAAGLAASPALAFDINAMSDAEREAFRAEIRAYMLDNPEIIMEAVQILDQRQAEAKAANDTALIMTNQEDIYNDGFSYVGGNPEGDVTLVEFFDYRCTYCKQAFPDLEELIKADGNIRVIYKEFPILGEDSVLASRFAVSAKLIGGDEAYAPLHNALMSMRANVTEASLVSAADKLGLDGDAILAGMSDPQVDQIIGENHSLAQRLQVSGTPGFVLGDQMLRGYVPLAGLAQLVAQVRQDG
ncbi:MAG: DsbA family protein [Maritimibacter sp.]